MKNIMWFREIKKEDIPSVGGKGANLGEMVNEAFPVPMGFVITAQAYFRFIKEKGIEQEIIKKIDAIEVEKTDELEKISKEIRELILRTPMNKMLEAEIKDCYSKMGQKKIAFISTREEEYVAVRSSATAEDLPSISEDEHVLLKVNGKPVYNKISEVYKKIDEGKNLCLEVPAMKNNKIEWTEAESLFRHKANKDTLFKIKTRTGREIVISPNHTLIVLDENKLQPKTLHISEMKKGMKVPVTAFIPEIKCEKTINVNDYVKGEEVAEENGKIMIKNNSTNWKIQNGLPKKIKITEDFAYFLGLYIAEGSTYKKSTISVTNSNNKLLDKAKIFLKETGIYKNQKINKGSIRIYCPSLVRFLHETSGRPLEKKGKGRLCSVKRIPDFVFGWEKKNIATFLRGCFDGDGTVSKSEISYCTTSKMLAGGMLKLLEILKIEFYINKKKNAFNISIARKDMEKFNNLIGFEHEKKKNRLNNLIKEYKKKEKHPEFKYNLNVSEELAKRIMKEIENKLPKEEFEILLCKECGNKTEQTSYYKNKKRYFCRNCKKTFYEEEVKKEKTEKYIYFDEKGRFIKGATPWNYGSMLGKYTLNALEKKAKKYGIENVFEIFNGTVKWDEVKEITPVKYDGWVYDFTVPGVENFASGLGGIITHNSASFAGQQETFLNIKGKNDVVEAVRKCWASLFTARAVYYRKKQGFETEKVGIAVVIQKMIDSEAAGILFTAEPTGDTTKMVIEAGYGLGEAVVSGSITPDTYTIEKSTFKIVEKKIAKQEWSIERAGRGNEKREVPKIKQMKQKIEDKFIVNLAKMGRQIENHYKKPMDIEWAMQEKQLYIVQARPITTLGMKEKTEKSKSKIIETNAEIIGKGLRASPGIASGKAVIIPDAKDADKVNKGDIIVTEMTSPDWVPIMEKSKAIITEEGGETCHAAIVSRELGIPCIVGMENAMQKIKNGEIVTVDGFNGIVYRGKIELEAPEKIDEKLFEDKEEIEEVKEEFEEEGEKFNKKEKDGVLKDHIRKLLEERAIKVKVNVALPEAAEKAAETGADGVGLLRAEHMITESGMHPAEFIRQGKEEELINAVRTGIKKVALLFKDKPVWYRTFDARSDEFRNLEGGEKEPKEDNPMIGWHGIRRSLDEPKLIQAEFKAIKELVEEGFTNLGVMLPFVISAIELKKAKILAREVGLEPGKDVKFGVMIETPASVWAIDELIEEGLDFVSFGTNDLTQLTLGIDRNNEHIQKLFSELHPAVLRSCEHVIKKCNKAGVITSICGQAASNEEMVEKLVEYGIKSVSANIDAVENIKRHVLVLEKRELLEKLEK